MPRKLKKFGPTATVQKTAPEFINSKRELATPIDPRLAQLLKSGVTPDTTIKPELPGVKNSSYKSPVSAVDQKIYNAVGQVNKFVEEKINSPLRKFYSTVDQIEKSVDTVKGVLGERGAIQTALNQIGALIGRDINFLDEGKKYKRPDEKNGPVSPPNYPYPRIAWEVTTRWRILRGLPSIRFYVNPNTISYDQKFMEQEDMVQKGFILTSWRDPNISTGNRFPKLDVSFNFQSSNILPETYAKVRTDFNSTLPIIDKIKDLAGGLLGGRESVDIDQSYPIPPGLLNFIDVLSIFHEDRTISKLNLYNIPNSLNGNKENKYTDLSQITPDKQIPGIEELANSPNYVFLSISTRIFPKMTMKGFFKGGYNLTESANSPLSFNTSLNFSAYETDPPWWDHEKIAKEYQNFYKKEILNQGRIVGGTVESKFEEQTKNLINKTSFKNEAVRNEAIKKETNQPNTVDLTKPFDTNQLGKTSATINLAQQFNPSQLGQISLNSDLLKGK